MDQRLITIETDIRDIARDLRDHKEQTNIAYRNLTSAINNLNVVLAKWEGSMAAWKFFGTIFGTIAGILIGVYLT